MLKTTLWQWKNRKEATSNCLKETELAIEWFLNSGGLCVKKTGLEHYKTSHKISKQHLKCGQITVQPVACFMLFQLELVNITQNFLNFEINKKDFSLPETTNFKIGFNCLSNSLQKVSLSLKNNFLQESNGVFKLKCKKMLINN